MIKTSFLLFFFCGLFHLSANSHEDEISFLEQTWSYNQESSSEEEFIEQRSLPVSYPIKNGVAYCNPKDCQKVLDGVVVINLDRHTHRFDLTKRLMEKAGFTNIERFSAVDGYFTDAKFFRSLNIYSGSPGQKGCSASHLVIWQKFLNESDKKWLFVAEDDMLPHSDFSKIFPLYWEQTPKDFDLIMVGNQMYANKRDPLVISRPSFCTHAYIISKAGARKLLDLYKNIRKDDIDRHVIDIFLISVMNGNIRSSPPLKYYCYNGSRYQDTSNRKNDRIYQGRDTGICFQNNHLESIIGGSN